MPKDDLIHRIKTEISILDLARDAGLNLKRHGSKDYIAHCIWHDDKTPSLVFTPDKNLFHCLGCGKAGSNIGFVNYWKSFTNGETVNYFKEHFSFLAEPYNGNGKVPAKEESKLANADVTSPEVQKALKIYCDYHHKKLKEEKKPIDYLLKRQITQGELIDEFMIGYSDGSIIDKLSENDATLQSLLDLKLIIKTHAGYADYFKDYLLFPIANEHGTITEIYGRSLTRENKHKYMHGPHKSFFNSKALIHKEVIICESIIDALSIMSLGYKHVIAGFGTGGFSDSMLGLFSSKGVSKAYVAFDNDKAGAKGAVILADKLGSRGITSYRIKFPDAGMDGNDFIRQGKESKKAASDNGNAASLADKFAELIKKADILYDAGAKDNDPLLVGTSSDKENWEEINGEYHFNFGDREYIIRGLANNGTDTAMKVFIRLKLEGSFYNDNNIDLYTSKDINSFMKSAAIKLSLDSGVIKTDLDKLIITCEKIQSEKFADKNKPQRKAFKINIKIQQKALTFLKEPLCLKTFIEDVEKCGLVGEPLIAAFCYLSTFSRYLPDRLHVIIQAESSAGKSTMLELINEFMPEEDCYYFTQISPKSFYYTEDDAFINKTIFIAEFEGMDAAIYPIKQMMSEKYLSMASTTTDPKTGQHSSIMTKKEVRVQTMITLPKEGYNEEIENRSVSLALNETPEQTRRILEMQRQLHSPEGVKMRRERKRLAEFYQHVQREIKALEVINPFTKYFDFTVDSHQSRRDHKKYLTFMDCVTLFFQHQREIVIDEASKKCVKTHLIDVAITHFMIRRLFPATLDELPPQTRNFFKQITKYIVTIAEEKHIDVLNVWIYRIDMRKITKLSNNRTWEHASRLVGFEYMQTKRDANGIAYRLRFRPDGNGDFASALQLASLSYIKKRASKKQRQEYNDFIPYLKQIFKALDPTYEDGEY